MRIKTQELGGATPVRGRCRRCGGPLPAQEGRGRPRVVCATCRPPNGWRPKRLCASPPCKTVIYEGGRNIYCSKQCANRASTRRARSRA